MSRHSARLVLLALIAFIWSPAPSHAQALGHVRIVFAKAALVVGAGGGRGVLTYRGRDYKFTISGLSLGVTAGASAGRLSGTVSGLREVSDLSGPYSGVGAGGALVGGAGGVHLKNAKGVTIALQGPKAGMEFSANLSGVQISLLD
jgi:hypothetical protein